MADECLFIPEDDAFQPTEWAVGPWSPDTLQASAYGSLLARVLEADTPAGMLLARVTFDLWRPVTREPLMAVFTVLREGTKARTADLFFSAQPAVAPSLAIQCSVLLSDVDGPFGSCEQTLIFERRH